MRIARSPAIPRTAGNCAAVVGTRSSSLSARRASCARAPLESTIRRPLLRSRALGDRGAAVHPAVRSGDRGGLFPRPPYDGPRRGRTPRPGAVKRSRGQAVDGRWCGCRHPVAAVGWSWMSTSAGSLPPSPGPVGDAGAAVLLSAMESAPAAIYCLTAGAEPVWANARARELGVVPAQMPIVGGRPVLDLVEQVLQTGSSAVARGVLGDDGPLVTATVRGLKVGDG